MGGEIRTWDYQCLEAADEDYLHGPELGQTHFLALEERPSELCAEGAAEEAYTNGRRDGHGLVHPQIAVTAAGVLDVAISIDDNLGDAEANGNESDHGGGYGDEVFVEWF